MEAFCPSGTIPYLGMDRLRKSGGRFDIRFVLFHTVSLPIVKGLVEDIFQNLVEDNCYQLILNLQ